MAAGAVLGLGNSLTNHFSNGGSFNNLDFGSIAFATSMGALTGQASGAVSGALTPYVSKVFSGIASPVLQRGLIGAATGLATGAAIGAVTTPLTGGNLWDNVGTGAVGGFATGGIGGAVGGLKYSRENRISPWTGKPNNYVENTVRINGQAVLSRDIGTGQQEMVLSGDNTSKSKGTVANLTVKSHTQQEVIDFLTHPNLGTQVTVGANGTVTYTTKYFIIKSYLSSDNRPSIQIQNLSSSNPFIKLRF